MPHFEIHATEVDAAKTFFAGLFGWTFQPMAGAEDIGYHLINGVHFKDGLTGGILARNAAPHPPGTGPRGGLMTFEVADCDASYAWALDHDGAEALPPTDFPGIGRVAYVEDGQGNIVGMMTPAQGDN